MRPILFNCEPTSSAPPSVSLCALVQAVAQWLWRCCCPSRVQFERSCSLGFQQVFTYNASMQPFVIALASDSAEDSDTVCLCHRPMSNCEARANCPTLNQTWNTLSLVSAQSASTATWMTSSSFPTQVKFSTHRSRPLR